MNSLYYSAFLKRGDVNLKKQNYFEALKDFEEVINIKPDYFRAFLNRWHVKKQMGDKEGDGIDWAKAIQ